MGFNIGLFISQSTALCNQSLLCPWFNVINTMEEKESWTRTRSRDIQKDIQAICESATRKSSASQKKKIRVPQNMIATKLIKTLESHLCSVDLFRTSHLTIRIIDLGDFYTWYNWQAHVKLLTNLNKEQTCDPPWKQDFWIISRILNMEWRYLTQQLLVIRKSWQGLLLVDITADSPIPVSSV